MADGDKVVTVQEAWAHLRKLGWTVLVGIAVVLLLAFFLFRGCTWSPFHFGPSKVDAGPGTVEVTGNNVKYTPKPTKENPNPKPVDTWKPKEAPVDVTPREDGGADILIHRTGFCFEPKVAVAYSGGDPYPALGLRFFYHERFGLEALASLERAHLGIDFRVGNLSASLGASQPYASFADLGTIGVYAAIGVFLK